MKKRIKLVILCALLILTLLSGVVYGDSGIVVQVNGVRLSFDVQPQMINDRTMVPMRAIFESLGATVNWDDSTQTVISMKGDTTVVLTIGVPSITINGVTQALDTAPCEIDGRTLVPVRAVSEGLNCSVDWDDATQTVSITTNTELVSGSNTQIESVTTNATTYYSGTDFPTYTSITGQPLIGVRDIDGNGTMYIYAFDADQYIEYVQYVLENGWSLFKQDQDEDTFKCYVNDDTRLHGIIAQASYGEVWIMVDDK